jgi:hypothetical protein
MDAMNWRATVGGMGLASSFGGANSADEIQLSSLGEADVTAAIPARSLMPINGPPSVQSDPMPDYVKHQDGVPRVGALSAEAVVRDYESAAKEIEAMGAELISAAKYRACARWLVIPPAVAVPEEADMAQFYFHCSNTRSVVMDRRGSSVSDLIEACAEAISRVRLLIASTSLEDWRDWSCMSSMRPVTRSSCCPSYPCSVSRRTSCHQSPVRAGDSGIVLNRTRR